VGEWPNDQYDPPSACGVSHAQPEIKILSMTNQKGFTKNKKIYQLMEEQLFKKQ
jgi:hypothetical protein